MTFAIHYRNRNNEISCVEWVVPTGWSNHAIRQAFAAQYPSCAEVITIEPQP